MEARGEYDCAILGDGPEALFTAFLLVLNGERVVVIQNSEAKPTPLRFMPGFDAGGVIHFFLQRWGMKKIPPIETTSGVLKALNTTWVANLRGDLKRRELGGLAHESSTPKVKKLIECLQVFEKDHSTLNRFLSDFSDSLVKSQEKYKKYLPHIPIEMRWKRSLKKTLKELKLSSAAQVNSSRTVKPGLESRENILLEIIHGLFRHGRTRGKGASPRFGSRSVLGSALELYTIRRAPFALDQADAFRAELKRILESKGVQFVGGSDRVSFKQDSAGSWDAFFAEKGSTNLSHVRFQNFIIAHDFKKESLKHFDDKSRKKLESEFVQSNAIRVEYHFKVKAQDLPQLKTGDYVYGEPHAEPIFVSLTEKGSEVIVLVKTEIVSANIRELEEQMLRTEVLKIRLAKKIREVFPSLSDAQFLGEAFHVERVQEFAPGRGISTRMNGVWSSTWVTYPEMGSFSPLLSSIELARRFVRHRKRELVL